MLRSKLEALGHQVSEEAVKNTAVERMTGEVFDVVFLDPSPLTSSRPIVLNIRRTMKTYPYIFLMSDSITKEEALKAGVNDLYPKPLDNSVLEQRMGSAGRLTDLVAHMGDDSEDFPSAGGVIAKSAINQLFLSAIDRADRYGERTYLLQISISNYKNIRDMDGPYAADYAVAKLCQYLVLLRRQSDIIGQTRKYEYTLMLQRPIYETEPVEAANRFAESLSKLEDIVSSGSAPVEISVTLLDVPTGSQIVKHVIGSGGAVRSH
jgi:CheY-like chemotaxis protein